MLQNSFFYSQIKAIVFDFGNVIINIDVPLTTKAFAQLTGKKEAVVEQRLLDFQIFKRYESGLFSDDEFRETMRQTLGYPLNDHEIDTAWNALLLDIPKDRIELLQELRYQYPLYLLSNTSNIHIVESTNILRREHGVDSLDELFNEVFLSYEMKLWKPDKAIYQAVLDKTGFQAHEILFLDDNVKNIESAKEMGIQTILVEPPKSITEYFSELG